MAFIVPIITEKKCVNIYVKRKTRKINFLLNLQSDRTETKFAFNL